MDAMSEGMKAKAVIVGSGVMGASIAFSLAKRGYAVAVVDKKSGPAQGSTGATSAIVRFTYSLRDTIALAWESKHLWENLRDLVEAPESEPVADFIRTGMAVIDIP
ncbi:FAD-dependent oxidoreductase [Brevibacterium sp.]|uniref:FAD-dependent oxidoreductase n=1 Tax=Brevibacterium sp. TaxID=1701 RepID=UPI00264724F0|nr:FAD-dependent oxidoreductase [Brevibacterium sp.]MDN6604131.1 FAD-binding oxidoreductase [Brevibacterium sp.]